MLDRDRLGDHPAHRSADHVSGLQLERAHQPDRVLRHVAERVQHRLDPPGYELADRRRRAVHVRRPAAVAVVEAHHVKSPRGELLAELVGPPDHLRAEPHDQDQRRV